VSIQPDIGRAPMLRRSASASQRGQSKSLNYGLRGLPTVTDLQAADAESVVLGRLVLLDVAARLERREEPKYVVLVELQAFREIGDAELFRLAGELLEHVQRVRDGLDDVVRFLSPHHVDALKSRFRLRRVHPVVNGRAEREMARGRG